MDEKKELPHNSLKKNVLLNVCKTLTTTLFPIVTYMYVSRMFGAEGYGKISFSNSVVQYFVMFAMLGIVNYATSEAAKVRDNPIRFHRIVSEIMLLNMISMIVSYLLLAVLLMSLPQLQPYTVFILVYSITIVLRVLGMEWLYSAVEDYFYITVRTICVQVVSLIAVFLFVRSYDDLLTYSFIQVAAVGGANLFNLFHARHYVKPVKVTLKDTGKHLKPVFTLFLMTLFINLFTQIDSTMLGLLQGDRAVGLYSAGDKMSSMVAGVIGAVSAVMLPRIAYYINKKEKEKMTEVIRKIVNVVVMISIPSAIGIFLLSEPIIAVFSGEDFAPAAVTVMILSARVLLSPVNAIFILYTFVPLGMEKKSMAVTGIAAATNMIVNFFLIQSFSYNGAAWATVMAELVEFVMILWIANKFLSLKGMFDTIWQYVVASIGLIVVCLAIRFLQMPHIASIMMSVVGSAGCYFIILSLLKNEYVLYAANFVKSKLKK